MFLTERNKIEQGDNENNQTKVDGHSSTAVKVGKDTATHEVYNHHREDIGDGCFFLTLDDQQLKEEGYKRRHQLTYAHDL